VRITYREAVTRRGSVVRVMFAAQTPMRVRLRFAPARRAAGARLPQHAAKDETCAQRVQKKEVRDVCARRPLSIDTSRQHA